MAPSVAVKPYTISIADDELEAWICFHTEVAVLLQDLRRDMQEAGVVCGIDWHFLADLAEAHQPAHNYCIARAISPEEGVEFFFSRSYESTPKRLPDGRVDFYNLDTIQNVVKQQILVAKVPLAARQPGQTVTGREIPTLRRPVSLPEPGPNVAVSEDGQALIALINGHPVLTENKLRVDSCYTHEGDVDFSIGNITCVGHLVITGDVKNGFSVKGAKDVTVHGVVDGGTIHAVGDIYLHGNVFGKQKSEIVGEGSVIGTYVDSVTIESQQDIVLSRGARRSCLKAAGSVVVRGDGNSIVGGRTQACDRIVSFNLGSDREICTRLEILPGVFDESTSLRLLRQLMVLLESDSQWLNDLRTAQELDESMEAMHRVIQRCRTAVPDLLHYCAKRQRTCHHSPKSLGTVVAVGTAYPGVMISIGSSSLVLTQPMSNVMFHQENNTIQVSSLDRLNPDGATAG